LHANKIRKFCERLETAIVNNCAIIFDRDEEFGTIDVVDTSVEVEKLPSQKIEAEKLSHLSLDQQVELLGVLDRFPEVFSEKPGLLSVVEHEIRVDPSFQPQRLHAYRVPEALKEEVGRQIKEMLDLGIIRPSTSRMASPLVCVLKGPQGQSGVRLAVDFR
jgi:hypothetical protein